MALGCMKSSEQEFQSRSTGSVCSRIQTQQYWVDGKLVDEWNVLWMHLEDGSCLRFCFDANVFFWKEAQPSLPPETGSHSYKLVEPPVFAGVKGIRIRAIRFSESPRSSELNLEFEGGTQVVVLNVDDRTSASVR